jgi:nucleoid DNA-binding protein
MAEAKKAAVKRAPTKAQVISSIADTTGLAKTQVTEVFAALNAMIAKEMKRNGAHEFQIPDTGVKIRRITKPARKSRMGRNPATGETIKIAAKPAQKGVKVIALKTLKDMIK